MTGEIPGQLAMPLGEPRGTECECGRCHQRFGNLRLFDAHQDVDYRRPHAEVTRCRDPRELRVSAKSEPLPPGREGLALVQDERGTWHTPAGLESRQRSTALLRRRARP